MAVLTYSETETVAPTVEPVTVAECRRHLDLDDTHLDAQVAAWIRLARRQVEHDGRVSLVTRTRARKLRAFPMSDSYIEMPNTAPLASVSSISYVDTAGQTQTLSTSVYSVDTARKPGVIWLKYGQVWPPTRDEPNAVTITYTSGYGATADYVPEEAKQAIYLVVRHRLDNPGLATDVLPRHAMLGYDYLVGMLHTGNYP